jgi:hypothetical protein
MLPYLLQVISKLSVHLGGQLKRDPNERKRLASRKGAKVFFLFKLSVFAP